MPVRERRLINRSAYIVFATAVFWAGLVGIRAMFDFELAVLFGIAAVVAEQVVQRSED